MIRFFEELQKFLRQNLFTNLTKPLDLSCIDPASLFVPSGVLLHDSAKLLDTEMLLTAHGESIQRKREELHKIYEDESGIFSHIEAGVILFIYFFSSLFFLIRFCF
jgi:hypothetical protein